MVITACSKRWPGSVHDSTVWKMSEICRTLSTSSVSGWLIGDSGYPMRERLIVPFLEPKSEAEKRFNKSLKRCRCVIERTNGVVKSRWRCLDSKNTGGLQFKPKISCDIIAACVVFHNYCRNRRIRDPEILPHILQDIREEQAEQSRRAAPPRQPNEAEEIRKGINVRNNIVNDYFS